MFKIDFKSVLIGFGIGLVISGIFVFLNISFNQNKPSEESTILKDNEYIATQNNNSSYGDSVQITNKNYDAEESPNENSKVSLTPKISASIKATNSPKPIEGISTPSSKEEYKLLNFTIKSGESISSIGKRLESQGVVSSSDFANTIEQKGLSNRIVPGTYIFKTSANVNRLIDIIVSRR